MTPMTEVIACMGYVLELLSKQSKYDQVAHIWDNVMHWHAICFSINAILCLSH